MNVTLRTCVPAVVATVRLAVAPAWPQKGVRAPTGPPLTATQDSTAFQVVTSALHSQTVEGMRVRWGRPDTGEEVGEPLLLDGEVDLRRGEHRLPSSASPPCLADSPVVPKSSGDSSSSQERRGEHVGPVRSQCAARSHQDFMCSALCANCHICKMG